MPPKVCRDIATERDDARCSDAKAEATRKFNDKARVHLRLRRRACRPRKLKRKPSFAWMAAMDYALKKATEYDGLESFCYEGDTRPEDPYSWNLLVVLSDMGPDGVCASNYLKSRAALNLESRWGMCHRAWRDLMATRQYVTKTHRGNGLDE